MEQGWLRMGKINSDYAKTGSYFYMHNMRKTMTFPFMFVPNNSFIQSLLAFL